MVVIVTMKTDGTRTIYCSIRGLEGLNALDPARYQEVKTKLGLVVAPYYGQVTFVEKTAKEVLWMTVQAPGEESWTLQNNNPEVASQQYEAWAREKKKMDN